MMMFFIECEKETNKPSFSPPALRVQPRSKGEHQLRLPPWLGFTRRSFMKKEGWEGLGAGRRQLTQDGHSGLHPAGPEEAAQAFLWICVGGAARRRGPHELFLFFTRYIHQRETSSSSSSTSAHLITAKHPSQTIKYSLTHTHAYTQFSYIC